ncbi:MAG: PA4642 family protein [Spongiibacteraceae bacterium]
MAKEKTAVVDEVWTEARIREFLDVKPAAGFDTDFHALLKAYQQMRAEDFEIFIGLFLEQGRNINAHDPNDRTLLSYVDEHSKGTEYAEILRRNGAK